MERYILVYFSDDPAFFPDSPTPRAGFFELEQYERVLMHSPIEMISLQDVENSSELLAQVAINLKANQSFLQLQGRISELENHIADRREFYNDIVTTFNTRIEQIPDMYVAGWLHCTPQHLFKVDDRDLEDVEIQFKMSA